MDGHVAILLAMTEDELLQSPNNHADMVAAMRGDALAVVSGHDRAICELQVGGVAAVAPFRINVVGRFL